MAPKRKIDPPASRGPDPLPQRGTHGSKTAPRLWGGRRPAAGAAERDGGGTCCPRGGAVRPVRTQLGVGRRGLGGEEREPSRLTAGRSLLLAQLWDLPGVRDRSGDGEGQSGSASVPHSRSVSGQNAPQRTFGGSRLSDFKTSAGRKASAPRNN